MPNTSITVSFACMNSAQAAKMIEYFDKLNAEGMQQLCDSLNNQPETWTEFRPDGSYGPASEPLNAVPPHVANPNASVVPPTAQGSAPTPYAPPAPPVPPVPPAPNMVPNAPAVMPAAPQSVPAPQSAPAPVGMPAAPAAPQYQQTSMAYTPIPNNIPASAPVIKKEQLQSALQLFASSSPARSASVRELLARFGVDNLNALPEASYPEFANSLRGMGCAV